MASGICTKIVQVLFFTFNFIFFCLGIAVLGVGIYSRVENDNWKDLLGSPSIYEAANILIAAGIIVAVIGFFGCFGAFKRNNCLLIFYAVFVFIIFVLEIAAGIYAYTKQDTIEESLKDRVSEGVKTIYGRDDTASEGVTLALNWFQTNIKCCGARGPTDWKNSLWYDQKPKRSSKWEFLVPESCCKAKTSDCNIMRSTDNGTTWNSTTVYEKGCVSAGITYAHDNMLLLGGVGVGIAIVQLLGILFSLKLRASFKKGNAKKDRMDSDERTV